jgi:hypothetical protein
LSARTKLGAGILAIALVGAGIYFYANFPINKAVQAHQILPSDAGEVIFAAPEESKDSLTRLRWERRRTVF